MRSKLSRFLFCLLITVNLCSGDELTNFFLKASKSVPRIGRSGNTEVVTPFILKASKSIPRIGRKVSNEFDDMYFKWLKQNGLLPRYVKRFDSNDLGGNENSSAEYAFDPDLFVVPQLCSEYFQSLIRSNNAEASSKWAGTRSKRTMIQEGLQSNKEILEDQMQH